jgi:four helix bundle protein
MSQADDLAARLKRFATRVIKFARTLPREPAADVIVRQLVGAGTGESANYHSARRGRSRAEFISKLNVAAEEADEAEHWLIVIDGSDLVRSASSRKELEWLMNEAKELRAILVASVRTARTNQRRSSNP